MIKTLLVVLLSSPLAWLSWLIFLDIQMPGIALGADAGETVLHFLGEWSLIMVLCAFAVSPLRRLSGYSALGRQRRLVGLFAFSYVCLHLFAYIALYLLFDLSTLYEDIVERPYITVGMLGFVCFLAMAITSTRGWQRRLKRNWQRLHRLVFVAIAAGLVHLWWLTRDGYLELAIYTVVYLGLCAERLWTARRQRVQSTG